jgi:LysR family glycine cleavage system transcriptional activator
MPRLAKFNEIHPHILVSIHASEKLVDLRSETVDLAIRYGPVDADVRGPVLFEDRFIAVADKSICPVEHHATISDFHNRPLLAFKWKNQTLEAPSSPGTARKPWRCTRWSGAWGPCCAAMC